MSGLSALASALNLIQMLGVPPMVCPQRECVESLDGFNTAFRNRIPLLYLRTLFEQNNLNQLVQDYERSLRRHSNLHADIRRLTHSLEATGIEYIFLKTLRYYPETPSDIDMILQGGDKQYQIAIDLF